jgi:cytochrome c oxidase cbb3-type subunit 2
VAALVLAVAVGAILMRPKGQGPEPIRHGRDACARCRMPVGSPGFAGQVRDRDGAVTVYDDLGCLLDSLRDMKDRAAETYVEDRPSGRLVPLRDATLVRSAETTPMGSGLVAFADAEAARGFARDHQGQVVTLDEALRAPQRRAEAGTGAEARPGEKRPFTDAEARQGKAVFARECSACHGERGRGDGPAAAFLAVKPRDITRGKFRVRTTPSGTAPTSADVMRTIERGLPGSAMPAFDFLPPEERRQVAAYVLDLAGFLEEKEPQPIPDPGTPPPATPESVARGQASYNALGCVKCHGPAGQGDGPSAKTLTDDTDRPIPARDLTTGLYRGGGERRDIFYRFTTGMDGTPMPGYADAAPPDERWALVDYVLSLTKQEPAPELPKDPIRAGRVVTARRFCQGCHVLDDGKGGDVGPDLRISGQKLQPEWVRAFLKAPRAQGKIYPWRPHRMPDLKLSDAEVDVLVAYVAAMGKRAPAARPAEPAPVAQAVLDEGKNLYVLRCAQCHGLGTVVGTPAGIQEGPDLIRAARRVDPEWALRFVIDPKKIDPKSRMTVPGLTPEQVKAIRDFVWTTSAAHGDGPPAEARGPETGGK